MKAFKRKLSSRDGASITFALMLFLVCAVLSSVVIVAGTASSGQLSRMAQTDQRYYAVTSAAELLTKAIEGQTVTIVTSREKTLPKTSDDGVTYTDVAEGKSAKVTTEVYYNAETMRKADGTQTFGAGENIDAGMPQVLLEGPPILVLDAACRLNLKEHYALDTGAAAVGGLSSAGIQNLKLGFFNTVVGDDPQKDALAVDIQEQLKDDGTLLFYVYKETGDAGKEEAYTLLLTFKLVADESTNKRTVTGAPVYTESDRKYTRTDTETTTTTTVYTCKLTSIQKSRKPT